MSKFCIDQNINKPVECDFACLIEREDALSKVQNFVDMLTVEKRGILRVVGNRGSGRTRFLNEIAQRYVESAFDLGFINSEEKVNTVDTESEFWVIDTEKVDILNFEKDIVNRLLESKKWVLFY